MNYLRKLYDACKEQIVKHKRTAVIIGLGVPSIALPSIVGAQTVCPEDEGSKTLQSCPQDPAPGPCDTKFYYTLSTSADPESHVQDVSGYAFYQGWHEKNGIKQYPGKSCQNGPAVVLFESEPNSPTEFRCPNGNTMKKPFSYGDAAEKNKVYVVVDPLYGVVAAVACAAEVCATDCYKRQWFECHDGKKLRVAVLPNGNIGLSCVKPAP